MSFHLLKDKSMHMGRYTVKLNLFYPAAFVQMSIPLIKVVSVFYVKINIIKKLIQENF